MKYRPLIGLLGLGALALSAAFCGPSAAGYCDAVCDCYGHCSDRYYDECIDDFEDAADRADRYECGDWFNDYTSCIASGDGCRGDDPDHYCDRERDDYKDCMKYGDYDDDHDDVPL